MRLFGVWATAGSTANCGGEHPLEMDDWDHFARAQQARYRSRTRTRRLRAHAPLAPAPLRWRVLAPVGTAFSPDRARVVAEGLAGPVVLRENATALPGRLDDYLKALETEYLPLARARGLALLGCFADVLRPNRALCLWSFRSWDHVRERMEALDADAELVRWSRRCEELLEDTEAWLLAPPPAGVLRT